MSDQSEQDRHSFVITVWLEEKETPEQPALWRGHITHALSKASRYVQSLEEISQFIEYYLGRMGVNTGAVRRPK